MPLTAELSLGDDNWKSLGPITREGWVQLAGKLSRSVSRELIPVGLTLVVRLVEDGKTIERVHRNLT